MSFLNGAGPYTLYGGEKGVLLIHGFTGSPAEMRPLANYLNERGYTVMVPLLPGHGTTVKDLSKRVWPEWLNKTQASFHELEKLCSQIYVAGISMGGLLSLILASRESVKKLAVMSTPIILNDKRIPFVDFVSLFRKYVKKARRTYDIEDIYNVSYAKYPLKALKSLLQLISEVKRNFPEITVPTLIIQSKVEKTVNPESARFIFANVKSENKEIVWLEKSGHMVILDSEREKVYKTIYQFFEGDTNEQQL